MTATVSHSGAQIDDSPSSIGGVTISTSASDLATSVASTMAMVETKPNIAAMQSYASKAFVCEICHKNLQSNYNLKRHQVFLTEFWNGREEVIVD